jgi:hypothetical protein
MTTLGDIINGKTIRYKQNMAAFYTLPCKDAHDIIKWKKTNLSCVPSFGKCYPQRNPHMGWTCLWMQRVHLDGEWMVNSGFPWERRRENVFFSFHMTSFSKVVSFWSVVIFSTTLFSNPQTSLVSLTLKECRIFVCVCQNNLYISFLFVYGGKIPCCKR